MGFLPDIDENGKLIPEKKPFFFRIPENLKSDIEQFSELQNYGRKEVSEDFSDSPFADRQEIIEKDL